MYSLGGRRHCLLRRVAALPRVVHVDADAVAVAGRGQRVVLKGEIGGAVRCTSRRPLAVRRHGVASVVAKKWSGRTKLCSLAVACAARR